MDEYRKRERELNARPIKKVAEAKMRKRKRELSKMNKAKKMAARIADDPELEGREKMRQMKRVYLKAFSKKKQEATYQVMTKGKRGSLSKPKGPIKVVDRRQKKDNRKQKTIVRQKAWRAKSTKGKMAELEKRKRTRAASKGDRRVSRRQSRGKPV